MVSGRRYLITGGTSGIGAMCAQYLTNEGHRVWVTGTREESVSRALDDGIGQGGSVCDVVDSNAVSQAFSEALNAFDALDGVFVNAGIDGQCLAAEELSAATFRRLLDVNLIGALTCAQAAYRQLARPGCLVFNASVNATRPERFFADYNASKAAVVALANTLALEWSDDGLTVVSVCPGYFRTSMTEAYLDDEAQRAEVLARIPMHRLGHSDDIGAVVSFLLSGQAPYLSGASIPVAGASNI